jgi:hypothetical protein
VHRRKTRHRCVVLFLVSITNVVILVCVSCFSTQNCRALLVHVVDEPLFHVCWRGCKIYSYNGSCRPNRLSGRRRFRPRCTRNRRLRYAIAVCDSPSLYRHCWVLLYCFFYINIDKICFNLLYCSHVVCFCFVDIFFEIYLCYYYYYINTRFSLIQSPDALVTGANCRIKSLCGEQAYLFIIYQRSL